MTPGRPEALARVSARVREELTRLARTTKATRDALDRWGPSLTDPVSIHWVGGLIHDFYTGIEKVFSEISPELNGRDLRGETWHRDLLHGMTLDLPGFRPPVIPASAEARLVELLKFRHLYRNLYSFELRWERVRALAQEVVELWPKVEADLVRFADALDVMART